MSDDFDKYLGIANVDIQRANDYGQLKSYVASLLYDNDKKIDMIHELEKKIKKLQEDLDILTSDNDNDSVWLEKENM